MPNTPRLSLQFPDDGEDPYFVKIKSFFESLDSFIFANMSDRNLVLRGGGTISFNSATNVVTWGSALELVDYVSGLLITISASSLSIADGEAAFIDTSRALSASVIATLTSAPSVGVGSGKIVVFARNGSKIIFRNGVVLDAGFSGAIIENGGVGDVRAGTEAFSAETFRDITFGTPFSDASYRVIGLVPDTAATLYAPSAQRSATGFRIATTDVASITGNVDWKVERSG